MGTPEFSVAALKSLISAGHEIACVYSQPPRPSGRGNKLNPTPVHACAQSLGIEVRTPSSLKPPDEWQHFAALKADAAVIVAYGLLLPTAILEQPKFGCFNIHASLLPRWRGAAPIQRAIMAGDKTTGICIMRMDQGLDTGPVLMRKELPIRPESTYASLHDELQAIGATAIVEALNNPAAKGETQSDHGATYAKKIDKAEAHINFNLSAEDVRNHIHGLSPFPGAWCLIKGSRVKVLKAHVVEQHGQAGTFVDDDMTIACDSGALRLTELQREGKAAMPVQEFLRGFSVEAGTRAS
jgi:methionyl-tRNA formyltransferase